jgi:hypothetical protein
MQLNKEVVVGTEGERLCRSGIRFGTMDIHQTKGGLPTYRQIGSQNRLLPLKSP